MLNPKTIKEHLDIVHVISRHVGLKPQGSRYIGLCPFHQEKTASFSVNPNLGFYKCFGCQKGGDVFQFEMEITGQTFPQTMRSLAKEFNIAIEDGDGNFTDTDLELYQHREALYLVNALVLDLSRKAHPWKVENDQINLAGRICSSSTVEHFQLTQFPNTDWLANVYEPHCLNLDCLLELGLLRENGRLGDAFRNRLIFPIRTERGKVAGFGGRIVGESATKQTKYLNSKESPIFQKSDLLYGLYENGKSIRESKQALICEGYFDVLTLFEHGFRNAVAICGTALSDAQAQRFRKHTERVILLLDGDAAGIKAARKAIPILEQAGLFVQVCSLPLDEDPDSFLRKNGGEALKNYLTENQKDAVLWLASEGIKNAGADNFARQKVSDEIQQYLGKTPFTSLKTAWVSILAADYGIDLQDSSDKTEGQTARKGKNNYAQDLTVEQQEDLAEYEFYEVGNAYFIVGKEGPRQISNFVILPQFLIKSPRGTYRVMILINEYDEQYQVTFEGNSLISLDSFLQTIEQYGNFIFKGAKVHLSNIKDKIYPNLKEAVEIELLGWQPEHQFWAWANGVETPEAFMPVDNNSMVQIKEKWFFLPVNSSKYGSTDEETNFRYEKRDVSFIDWFTQIIEVYQEHQNAYMMVLYYLSSLFREAIFQNLQFFPILFAFGPPSTGKNNMALSLSHMFGKPQKQFFLSTGTDVALGRKVSKFSNGLVWLDEYKNGLSEKRIQILKGFYDGAGYARGTFSNDNRTSETVIKSGIMITGQDLPTADPALLTRTILLSFSKTKFSQEETDRFQQLKTLQAKGGLSYLSSQMAQLNAYLEEHFGNAFPKIQRYLKEKSTRLNHGKQIEERLLNNYAVLWTTVSLLADKLTLPLEFLQKAESALISIQLRHNQILSSSNDMAQFWEMVEVLINQSKLVMDRDLSIEKPSQIRVRGIDGLEETINFSGKEHILFLRLTIVHSAYLEACRSKYGRDGLSKGTLEQYLKNSPAYLGNVDSKRFCGKVTSAMALNYALLNINIDGMSQESS